MKIYKVESIYSRELIKAKDIIEAASKYNKINKDVDPIDREIKEIRLMGELSA